MAFWSGQKLAANQNLISDFLADRIDCNSYRLRMGGSYYCTTDESGNATQVRTILPDGKCFSVPPGQFAFLLTKETIEVPDNAMAFISMRTGIKLQGLINVSGFNVDPGYKGRLIYAVFNASPSPIQICENDPIFKIWFCDLNEKSEAPYVFDKRGYSDIPSDMIKGMNKEILSLQGLAERLRQQQNDMMARFAAHQPTIDNLNFIWRAIIIGILVAILAVAMHLQPSR